jgi:hypothetical protein
MKVEYWSTKEMLLVHISGPSSHSLYIINKTYTLSNLCMTIEVEHHKL